MKTKRTDGQGVDYKNTRLTLLANCLETMQVVGIYQLNDHKGDLTVVWENKIDDYSKEKVKDFWYAFSEYNIEHKIVTTQNIYDDLYNELTSKYLGSCDRNMNTNIIEVDVSSGLFDYDKYHFYGVDITEMKLSKIVKKYSSNFYCEWKNCNTQIISIDFNNIYKKLK
jgi:hypothetical protein